MNSVKEAQSKLLWLAEMYLSVYNLVCIFFLFFISVFLAASHKVCFEVCI